MVPVLTALVAVLFPLTVLNLVLLFAVIRRLREAESKQATAADTHLPQVGAEIGEFATADVSGAAIGTEDVDDGMFVTFVLPGCGPCEEQVRSLRSKQQVPADRVVFFVFDKGDAAETQGVVDSLAGLGRVAVAGGGTPVDTAFGGIESFPTLVRTGGGRIVAVDRTWDAIAQPVGASAR